MDDLIKVCKKKGNVEVYSRDHALCVQPRAMRKISKSVKEFFITIDF